MNALAQHKAREARPHNPLARAGRSTRVLVVDDSRLVAEALIFTLESDPQLDPIGYALDGWEALELVSELEPDVLLVGSELVGLDGLAFTRLVHMVWPRVLIIMLAQALVPREVEEAYGVGAADYLPKDRSADELLDAINAARARQTGREGEPRGGAPRLGQLTSEEAPWLDAAPRILDP